MNQNDTRNAMGKERANDLDKVKKAGHKKKKVSQLETGIIFMNKALSRSERSSNNSWCPTSIAIWSIKGGGNMPFNRRGGAKKGKKNHRSVALDH